MKTTKKNKSVRAVPEGFSTVTPFIIADNAIELIEFMKDAFEGEQTFLQNTEDGKIMHATVRIGNSTIMITDSMDGMPPQAGMFYLYLENVDEVFQRALKAKATTQRELRDEFYGDRAGAVKDKWGNVWWLASHIEDVDDDELEKRAREMQEQHEHEPH